MNTKQIEMKDPVCGMTMEEPPEHHSRRDAVMFYFCSAECQQKFLDSPPGTYPDANSNCCGE